MNGYGQWRTAILMAGLLVSVTACSRQESVQVSGSDTMLSIGQAWAEEYGKTHEGVSIQVRGGGSGVGIADLANGKIQMANSSRQIKPKEIEEMRKNTGIAPKEYIVGLDALAIIVNKENPMETITIPQLAEIYGEGGSAAQWGDIGVENTPCASGEIVRINRQNSSGTYAYFKEAVLQDREFKQGAISQGGTSDVIVAVRDTPCAVGYSGMGYVTDEVKTLSVAREKGEPGVTPTLETAKSGEYPISRPLFIYTAGEPTGPLKDFLDWIMSAEGQKVLVDQGYVPAPATPDASSTSDATEE